MGLISRVSSRTYREIQKMPRRRTKNQNLQGICRQAERQKVKEEMQYGSFERRIGKECICDFDQCAMSMKHTTEPVLSKDGIIFDKKSILEYILKRKKMMKQQKKAYEAYLLELAEDKEREKEVERIKVLHDFIKTTDGVKIRKVDISLDTPSNSIRGGTPTPSLSKYAVWDTPADGKTKLTDGKGCLKRKLVVDHGLLDGTGHFKAPKQPVEKPDKYVKCPITGNRLEYKELMEIKFRPIDPDAARAPVRHESSTMGGVWVEAPPKWCCAISGDPLTNNMQLLVLKTPGEKDAMVISESSYNNTVKPSMICPFTNKKITDDCIFKIRRSGTGFSKT